jgi:hypothetical protein
MYAKKTNNINTSRIHTPIQRYHSFMLASSSVCGRPLEIHNYIHYIRCKYPTEIMQPYNIHKSEYIPRVDEVQQPSVKRAVPAIRKRLIRMRRLSSRACASFDMMLQYIYTASELEKRVLKASQSSIPRRFYLVLFRRRLRWMTSYPKQHVCM